MSDFFGTIYCWFQSLWCDNLNWYLWGYDSPTQSFIGVNIYNVAGIITSVISLLMVLIYYYLLSHPRWSRWWSWLIALIVNGIIGLFVAYGISYSKYINGYIPQDLLYEFDSEGNIISYLISPLDCWGFGIAGFIVSTILFIIFSFIFKWWSRDAKHVPIL